MRRFISKLAKAINPTRTARPAKRSERRTALGVESLENRDLMTVAALPIILPPIVLPPSPIQVEYTATANERDAYGTNVQRILGAPTSNEMNVPGVAGARMETYQGGAIYWSRATDAHVVYGGIGGRYNGLGGPARYGLPTSDEASVPSVPGERVSYFQGGRALYWSPSTGARAVYGAIGGEYWSTAYQGDYYGTNVQRILGAPTSDETDVPGVAGARMNTFQGGTIYWSPSTGAHTVYGGIGGLYRSMGGPTSYLGLPTSNEQSIPGGRVTYFQHGKIVWTPQGGAYAVRAVTQMTFNSGPIGFSNISVTGWAQLTVYANGSYNFVGHFHDPSFWSYNDSLVFAIKSPSGVLYTFTHTGHMGGFYDPASRNDDFSVSGTNPALAAGWADLEGARSYWRAGVTWDVGPLLDDIKTAAGVIGAVIAIV